MVSGRGPGLHGTLWDEQEGFESMSLPLAAKLQHWGGSVKMKDSSFCM